MSNLHLLCVDVRGTNTLSPLVVYAARENGHGVYVRVRNDVGHWRRYLRRRFVEIVLPPVSLEAFNASWQK